MGDLWPAWAEAHADGLLLEIGVLATGHLVEIDFGGAVGLGGVEGLVESAHRSPVVAELLQRFDIESGVTRRVLHGGDDGVEVRLRGAAGHGGDGGIDDIDTCGGGFEDAGGVQAAGVMRVEVNRDADFIFERFDELLGGKGADESGHVFDAEHVCAHLFQLLGQADVVFKVVLVALRVQDVAGVAECAFADGVRVLAHCIHGGGEVGQVVE